MFEAARRRMELPTPRVALGLALRGIASAAIDVSDGLLGDLGHILKQSGVGATVQADEASRLVGSRTAYDNATRLHSEMISTDQWRSWALAGGDDYELLFSAPVSARSQVTQAAESSQTAVTRIGRIEQQSGLRLVDSEGRALPNNHTSFDHFT
jgi:thiamine-monophosphate kinase